MVVPRKITLDILRIVESAMQLDDERTEIQLQKTLVDKGHALSLKIFLALCTKLGWTFRGSEYCQIIRHENKLKRLSWVNKSRACSRTRSLVM